jgi:hypothetical protein
MRVSYSKKQYVYALLFLFDNVINCNSACDNSTCRVAHYIVVSLHVPMCAVQGFHCTCTNAVTLKTNYRLHSSES